tara:strand:+ start:383 stop:592 length:210 start_codon:yes stop_codon:yes gene_type:complete
MKTENNQTRYLTQKQVAEILSIKVSTLNFWRCTGKHEIPYCKLGRVILYPSDLFYEWLKSHSSNLEGGC